MHATPATIAQAVAARKLAAQVRYQIARQRDAARNGYRGPLTRAELASQASR